jgi:hypothetical protein
MPAEAPAAGQFDFIGQTSAAAISGQRHGSTHRRAIMKIRTTIAATGAAVVLGSAAALALPAVASAHPVTHTLKFTAVHVNSVPFTSTNFGAQDTDANSTGKTIGFDDLNITYKGQSGSGDVALDISGGFLYGTIATTNAGKTFSGKVTGGTGPYKAATGTIAANATSSTKTAVTITYAT